MQCEMCGKTVGTRRYMVEGTVMSLGLECARYGTPMDAPAPVGTQASMQQLGEKAKRAYTRLQGGESFEVVARSMPDSCGRPAANQAALPPSRTRTSAFDQSAAASGAATAHRSICRLRRKTWSRRPSSRSYSPRD